MLVLAPGSRAATTQDQITYNEVKGGAYLAYAPASGSGFNQSISAGGGGCSSPTIAGSPILQFSAAYYPNGYGSPQTAQAASAGAYQGRTGVCAVPQDWSIEVGEGLIFSIGPNQVTTGRLFSRAQIALQRQDKSTSADPPATGNLVLRLGGKTVGTVPFAISGPNGTAILADTGMIATGFDQVEIQVDTPSTASVSVVGPTSTFTLFNQLCSGNIQTSASSGSDQVNASITYVSGATCKTYTNFSATDSGSKSVTFAGASAPGVALTAHFDWGSFPFCAPPSGAGPAGTPPCPPTKVSFDGGLTFQPETMCVAANPPLTPAWCTTGVQYKNVTIGGTTYTQISEDWSGFGDPIWKY
jgi:hypothetical protein